MLEREQIICFFIAVVCMAVFFTACYLTFPHSVDIIYHEYEIDGYLYNCERIGS